MSATMAWYPLPQSGGTGTPSGGGELLDDQSGGWALWSFGSADDDHGAGVVRAETHGSSDERTEEGRPAPPQQQQQATDDIFMSQFSDEEVRKMDDAPFEALGMFPDSMHQLLSYENMLSGGALLSCCSSEDLLLNATLGVDAMDTCGFPLFSHDLQLQSAAPDLTLTPEDQDGASFAATKRSRSSVADEGGFLFQALVLRELEDVVFQLTKRTRVCFRDAFFRLAESSSAKCGAANGTPPPSSATATATGGRISTPGPGRPERETNAIDRTVADLTMRPAVLASRCPADGDSGAEAHSATTDRHDDGVERAPRD
ncbi:uncharacterized protein [Zea mays]|uniref:Uncharacterized protein n=1 Tax=Zea mays TaxID=4577 RepID=C4JAZ8_MAIZE|nr:uncharacterized protein LOC100381542 isoform X1 [Zea mays]ACR38348.1 unknown [Zea mays]AQK89221.1 hypothetical protein ZEAMMB73_Zm00001d008222 [Zea mays]|eukprot:XP_008655162.1 hypothetical protein [Zea mays]